MTSTELDAAEADDAPRRGLLRQAAITVVMILMGIMIALDVIRRSRRSPSP